jgi:nucleoside-diphosphate-sugar epimerase
MSTIRQGAGSKAQGAAPDAAPPGLSALSGHRLLLTGASGFLGSHLLRMLEVAGLEIHAASRSLKPGTTGRVTGWAADLSNRSDAETLFRRTRPDVVFHLAGHSSGAPGLDQVDPTLQKDLVACVNVLAAASAAGVRRLVMTGSLTEPAGDVAEPVPSSPYAAAKWAGCAYGRMFHALYGLPVVIVRLFMGYGPGQPRTKLIPSILESLLRSEAPRLASGRQEFDWTYVDDLVEGIAVAAVASGVEGRTFEIGTGRLTSVRQIAERLVELVGTPIQPHWGALPDRPLEEPRAARIAEAQQALGWHAMISLEEGLARTVASFRSQEQTRT